MQGFSASINFLTAQLKSRRLAAEKLTAELRLESRPPVQFSLARQAGSVVRFFAPLN
jgi:hypothetical protein